MKRITHLAVGCLLLGVTSLARADGAPIGPPPVSVMPAPQSVMIAPGLTPWDWYRKGKRQRTAGIVLLAIGIPLAITGVGLFVIEATADKSCSTRDCGQGAGYALGVIALLPGLGLTAAGSGLLVVGTKKIEQARQAGFSLGSAPAGSMGTGLRFDF